MERQEAVLLLKEIMSGCESFHTAQAVSVSYNKITDSWELGVSWLPDHSEMECLRKIIAEHKLEMVEISGKTVFRSVKI